MPRKRLSFSQHTYADMASLVLSIREEIKKRNPIFVNIYIVPIDNAVRAIESIAHGESENFTSECGPKEPKA